MTIRKLALAAFCAVAALATPAVAQNNEWRRGHSGPGYGHADYAWPYRPGQDRVDEGPGFYQGYGYNSHNSCFSGESMYDGC
jgi:hypothetical protein